MSYSTWLTNSTVLINGYRFFTIELSHVHLWTFRLVLHLQHGLVVDKLSIYRFHTYH